MNVREDFSTVNPFGGTSECSKFTIDDITNPFILRNIMVPHQHYTLSFYAKADTESVLTIQGTTLTISPAWERYILLFTSEGVNLNFVFGTGVFYIYKPKLELGNKATDWTPAPEDLATGDELDDVQDDLDNTKLDLKYAHTLIEKNASDILLRASLEEFNDLTKRVSDAELKLTPDGIVSIVGTTYAKTDDVNKAFENVSTVIEQTDQNLTVKINDAAKTATNFLKYDGGLIVGEIPQTETGELGNNVLITTTGVNIRNGITTLAQFGSDNILLGLGTKCQVSISDDGFTMEDNGTLFTSISRSNIRLGMDSYYGSLNILKGGFIIEVNQNDDESVFCSLSTNYVMDIFAPDTITLITQNSHLYLTNEYIQMDTAGKLDISSVETLRIIGDTTDIQAMTNLKLRGPGISSSWVNGRDNALFRMRGGVQGYLPAISISAYTSSWEIGTYHQFGDDLVFANITNDNYSSSTNTAARIIRFNQNGMVTGIVGCNNNWTISGGALYVGSSVYNQGFIELYGATPFIDFHFGDSGEDFTSRIIETASGKLRCEGDWTAGGHIVAGGYLSCEGRIKSQGTYDYTSTQAANLGMFSSYWTFRSTASSKRYKHDIKPLGSELNSEKLLNIPVHQYIYNFDYLGEEDQRYNTVVPGFIAEEVYENYPIAAEITEGQIEDWNHRMIIPPMLDLIQKLWRRVEQLENKEANNG